MNAVSMREAIGSAATANAEGNAIPNISFESASNLKISLHLITIYHIQPLIRIIAAHQIYY
jgi:hypothetical protein